MRAAFYESDITPPFGGYLWGHYNRMHAEDVIDKLYAKSMPNMVAFGPVFPGDILCEHKADEHITLDNLLRNTCIIASAMYELAK